jgi:hypothetical protein
MLRCSLNGGEKNLGENAIVKPFKPGTRTMKAEPTVFVVDDERVICITRWPFSATPDMRRQHLKRRS